MDENSINHIHLVDDNVVGNHKLKGNIDIVNIVIIGITKEPPESSEEYELHRLLGILLSNKLEVSTKLAIIKEEYLIPVSEELREDVNIMCNLGQGIEEEGIAIGEIRGEAKIEKKIVLKMYNKGHTAEFIAGMIDMDINNVKAIIEDREC